MNIFKRLMGRAEMALNTARTHPDRRVQEDCQLRAKAYMAAADDVKGDEQIKAGMHLAWMVYHLWEANQLTCRGLSDRDAVQRAVDEFRKAER